MNKKVILYPIVGVAGAVGGVAVLAGVTMVLFFWFIMGAMLVTAATDEVFGRRYSITNDFATPVKAELLAHVNGEASASSLGVIDLAPGEKYSIREPGYDVACMSFDAGEGFEEYGILEYTNSSAEPSGAFEITTSNLRAFKHHFSSCP